MALPRKDIRAVIEDESLDIDAKVKKILDMHHSDTDSIRDQNDELQKQLAAANKERDDAKAEKDKAVSDFEAFKTETAGKETKAAKESALRTVLKSLNMTDKRIDTVIRATDMNGIEVGKDGKIKDEAKLTESIKADWAEFIPEIRKNGAGVDNPPPGGSGGTMTRDKIMEIKDPAKRQQAIADNHELFGF